MADVFDSSLLETVKRPLADTGDGHLAEGAADEILKMADDVKLLRSARGWERIRKRWSSLSGYSPNGANR